MNTAVEEPGGTVQVKTIRNGVVSKEEMEERRMQLATLFDHVVQKIGINTPKGEDGAQLSFYDYATKTVSSIEKEAQGVTVEHFKQRLAKAVEGTASPSAQGVRLGIRAHPFNLKAAADFMVANIHHSTCIKTKVNATVGLGPWTAQTAKAIQAQQLGDFSMDEDEQSNLEIALDPLCENTWQETLSTMTEDYYSTGNGYLEVVRAAGPTGPITGVHNQSSYQTFIWLENEAGDYHYMFFSENGAPRRFARFGDLQGYIARNNIKEEDAKNVSEVIHFKAKTPWNRWYGVPEWLSSTSSMELAQALQQHKYDFFMNRGVPEFMLFILGKKLPKEDWDDLVKSLKSQIGVGNSHKSFAMNIDDPEVKIEFKEMGSDAKAQNDGYETLRSTLAQDIVSSHRVPPLLAGIHIPGKMAASNELPNSLMGFQVLVVGPVQQTFRRTLFKTIGSEKTLKLTYADFRYKKITEELDITLMGTMSRMTQTAPEAKAQGRDLSQGLKQ